MAGYVPGPDQEFLGFAQNYSGIVSSDPVAVGLTAPIAAEIATLTSDFETKLNALNSPENRNPVATLEKTDARNLLEEKIRVTARVIQACLTVTDVQRTQLRLTVRDTNPTPVDPIDVAPALTVLRIFGREIRVQVRQAGSTNRAKLPIADGATIYSFIGATPPAGAEGWTSEGNITRDNATVVFDESVAPGTKVWFTAAWYNTRGAGPGCTAVPAIIGAEGTLVA